MADSPRIEELRRRVQSDPASIAFAALAEEYRRAGRFDEAIDTCKAGLVRHPSYLSAHVTLGRALIDVGRLEEARGALQYVLKLAPENLAAIRGLAEIHDRLGGDAAVRQAESPSEEPAGPTMTVEEIHAASGFKRPEPEPEEPVVASAHAPDSIEVEPPIAQPPEALEPMLPSAIEEEAPAPAEIPIAAAPVADVEPPPVDVEPPPVDVEPPPVDVEPPPVNVEPPRIESPALAGLEQFLNAIQRARAERVAAR